MPLANFRKPQQNKGAYRRTEFLDLSQGEHIIRILTDEAKVFDTHYVKGISIKCLDDACPICRNNRSMWAEYGKDANKKPGYIPRSERAYLNVYDRTLTKICPNEECKAEIKKAGAMFPAQCPKCGSALASVRPAPLNKVKVLSKGKQFFEALEMIDSLVLSPETQDRIGITNYDLRVLAMGPKVPPTPAPIPDNNDVLEVPEEELFDLDKALIVLSSEEILDLMRGVQLADIFRARNPQVEGGENQVGPQSAEMKAEISGLFEL